MSIRLKKARSNSNNRLEKLLYRLEALMERIERMLKRFIS